MSAQDSLEEVTRRLEALEVRVGKQEQRNGLLVAFLTLLFVIAFVIAFFVII